MIRPPTRGALLATAVAAVAALAVGAPPASAAPPAGDLTVTIGTGGTITAPAQVRPGLRCLEVTGPAGGSLQLARPRHGADAQTLADDVAAFSASGVPTALEADFVLVGGADTGARMCTALLPGTYYALDTAPETPPDAGRIATITVSGTPRTDPLPHVTGVVTAVRTMSWAAGPARIAPRGALAFMNAGSETHLASLVRFMPGRHLQDLEATLARPDGDLSTVLDMTAHLDTGAVSAGGGQVLTYDLPPGEYALLCFWPDLETGVPHAVTGMVRSITVG